MNDSRNQASGRNRLMWASGAFVGLLFVCVVALAAMPGAVHADGRMGGHAQDFIQWRMEKMLDRVDATDEQQARIEEIVERRMASLEGLHGERGEMREQAVALLTAESVDRDAIEAMRAEQVERLVVVSREVTQGLAEIADVLTREQRAELAEMVEKHGDRHSGHRGRFWRR